MFFCFDTNTISAICCPSAVTSVLVTNRETPQVTVEGETDVCCTCLSLTGLQQLRG